MKKVLLTCLILLSVLVSSTAFSAIPEGKFPIQFLSSRKAPNEYERALIRSLESTFNNSSRYRVSNIEENRLAVSILIEEFIPGVISSDWLASATPVRVYTIVWLAKPKNEHAYYLWHDVGRLTNYKEVSQYILDQAGSMVDRIKNRCPYVFEN